MAVPDAAAKFVQVESRMSQTGANADEWLACQPGTEGALALGIAHVILTGSSRPAGCWARVPARRSQAGLPACRSSRLKRLKNKPASARRSSRAWRMKSLSADRPPRSIGGAPLAQTNGLFNALAANALEALVDSRPR